MAYRVGPPPPPWKPEIALDFLFSAAGAGMLLVGAVAFLRGDPFPLRVASLAAAPCLAASLAILVHDLGVPSRFWRMLAQLNPRSVMSWGAFLLNACFAVAGLCFLLRVFEVGSLAAWRALAAAACVVAPATLAYKGMLLSVTAVPFWRKGRLFGALLVADGVALGAALLVFDYVPTELVVLVPTASLARAFLMLAVLARAGEDRKVLLKRWTGAAYLLAFLLSLATLGLMFVPGPHFSIAASVLLRAALVRAPYGASAQPTQPARPEIV